MKTVTYTIIHMYTHVFLITIFNDSSVILLFWFWNICQLNGIWYWFADVNSNYKFGEITVG